MTELEGVKSGSRGSRRRLRGASLRLLDGLGLVSRTLLVMALSSAFPSWALTTSLTITLLLFKGWLIWAVFDLEPAGTFGMYPICHRRVSGRYFQPEPAMYSRYFCWFPGSLAPSASVDRMSHPLNNNRVMANEAADVAEGTALDKAETSRVRETRPSPSSSPSLKLVLLTLLLLPRLPLSTHSSSVISCPPPSHSLLRRPHHST